MEDEKLREITYDIIGAAFDVRKECGPGLLENYYEAAFEHELLCRNRNIQRQMPLEAYYKGVRIKDPYRMDIVVEGEVIVELKTVTSLCGRDFSQLMTYLYLSKKRLGFLINFSAKDFTIGKWSSLSHYHTKGIYRVIR